MDRPDLLIDGWRHRSDRVEAFAEPSRLASSDQVGPGRPPGRARTRLRRRRYTHSRGIIAYSPVERPIAARPTAVS